jgi:hypothetical protein
MTGELCRKRPRLNDHNDSSDHVKGLRWRAYGSHEGDWHDPEQDQSLWSGQSLFAIDATTVVPDPPQNGEPSWITFNDPVLSLFDPSTWATAVPSLQSAELDNLYGPDAAEHDWLYPVLFPNVPSLEDRFVDLNLENPYDYNGPARHTSLRTEILRPEGGAVNGYIKFRIRDADPGEAGIKPATGLFGWTTMGVHHRGRPEEPRVSFTDIPHLPPNFGRGLELDVVDNKLLKFCESPPSPAQSGAISIGLPISLILNRFGRLLPGPHAIVPNKFLAHRDRTDDGRRGGRETRYPCTCRSLCPRLCTQGRPARTNKPPLPPCFGPDYRGAQAARDTCRRKIGRHNICNLASLG